MKKLLIIVPKDSAIDSYLADAGFIYDLTGHLITRSFYEINLTDKLQLINLLISKFSPADYFIRCINDRFIFSVRS